jgi:hypothetical protein
MKEEFPFVDMSFLPSVASRQGIVVHQEKRQELLDMMDRHARKHPLIPTDMQACMFSWAIHQDSAQEVYDFCKGNELPDAWAYLSCEWYCSERWNLWARSTTPGVIPGASTTMMVEAHWSLIKRHHLVSSPRARLDRVIYVLLQDTIPQLAHKWSQAVLLRRYVLPFEKSFLHEWNKFADIQSVDTRRYFVDLQTWICSCPAYVSSRFLICKHLYHVSAFLSTNGCLHIYSC